MWRFVTLVVVLSWAGMVAGRVDTPDGWRHVYYEGEVDQNTGCKCISYDCGCCLDVDIPKIGLNDKVCANISYLPDEYGVSVTVDIDGRVIINETVSAKNPPPICVGLPYLEKEASVCFDLHDLNVTRKAFSGCAALEARLYHVFVEKVELGCFSIPLSARGRSHKLNTISTNWVKVMEVMADKKRKVLGMK